MSLAKVLDILCCPKDHSKLQPAGDQLVRQINSAIAGRRVRNHAGRILEEPIDDGLIRAGGDWLYPIVRGIPVLLSDEAIDVEQARGAGS